MAGGHCFETSLIVLLNTLVEPHVFDILPPSSTMPTHTHKPCDQLRTWYTHTHSDDTHRRQVDTQKHVWKQEAEDSISVHRAESWYDSQCYSGTQFYNIQLQRSRYCYLKKEVCMFLPRVDQRLLPFLYKTKRDILVTTMISSQNIKMNNLNIVLDYKWN